MYFTTYLIIRQDDIYITISSIAKLGKRYDNRTEKL